MMNNSNKNTPKGGQAKDTFSFDPAKVTINELYITQIYGENGYTTGRIFSNGKMHARLLLKYSCEIETDNFPDETEAEIMAIVKAEAEAYFKSDDNLIICQAFHPRTDITETEWQKAYEPNGYLIDLDNDGRHIDFPVEYLPGYMEVMSQSAKSQPLYNPMKALAEPRGEIITEEDSTFVNLVFTVYVTPPDGTKTNYTLWARYRYEDNGEVHTQDSSEVSLQTESFNVTEDTVQLTCITRHFYTDKEDNDANFAVLYALCYRGDNYGAAKPYNINIYPGLVLASDKNLCLNRLEETYVTAMFYYPGTHNPYELNAGSNDHEYSPVIADIVPMETGNVSKDLTTVTPVINENLDPDANWDAFDGSFDENLVRKAHRTGVPVVVRKTADETIFLLKDTADDYLYFEIFRPYGIEDNCGNTFDLIIEWPTKSIGSFMNGYRIHDYDPHDVDTSGEDYSTYLYQPDFENIYKLKVWPTNE